MGYQILLAYQRAHRLLVSRSLHPRLQKLDNEYSAALIYYLDEEAVEFQLAPPQVHRQNAAERAIKTWKKHFIAILYGCERNFPMNLWDKIIPQVVLTENLLRRSNLNPDLSADVQVWGQFDFSQTPLAPLGTMVMVHEKPVNCKTRSPNTSEAWYLGPAVHHYRCYQVWVWETKAERVNDMLAWLPTNVVMPIPGHLAEPSPPPPIS